MRWRALVATVGLLVWASLVAAVPAAATPGRALIQGSGSSSAANAVNQWISDVAADGLDVVYTGSGSAQGRTDFANGTTDFAVSDIPYQGGPDTNCIAGQPCRDFRYVPLVGGGTSFPYQLKAGGRLIRSLRLSGLTLAKIFTGAITRWDDPQIRSDNNGRALPAIPIVPVIHAEGSGASYRFSEYLAHEYPAQWTAFAGSADPTTLWPNLPGAIAASGSDAVMNYVSSAQADGAIGYDEYSYPLAKGFPVAKVRNRAGYFVLPTAGNVAIALRQATADPTGPADLTKVFADTDPRTYPLSSFASAFIPTGTTDPRMTSGRRQTLVDYLAFSVCRGQREVAPIGGAPLPLNLTRAALDAVSTLHDADPAVDLTGRTIATCENPTFTAGENPTDTLDSTVEPPPACDHDGQGPCGTDDTPTPPSATTLVLAGSGTVRAGTGRRITATLRTGSRAVAGARVGLYSATPHHAWHRISTLSTDRHGASRATVSPTGTTRYQARFGGDGDHAASRSNAVTVAVRYAVSATISSRSVSRGHRIAVTGRVDPGRSGDVVVLQLRTAGHWRNVGAAVLRYVRHANGHRSLGYTLRFVPRVHRTYLLRVSRPATPANSSGSSATLRLQSR